MVGDEIEEIRVGVADHLDQKVVTDADPGDVIRIPIESFGPRGSTGSP